MHTCKEIEILNNSDAILRVSIKYRDKSWYLLMAYYANEDTVNDGEASFVGEKIHDETELLIFFCPYCGKKLE